MNTTGRLNDDQLIYKKVLLSDRFDSIMEKRGAVGQTESRPVLIEEARFLARKLRRVIGETAQDAALARVLSHNPQVMRVVDRGEERESPFLAYLPLNEAGLDALTSGALDRRDPDLRLLCRAGEPCAAIYIWCMYSPGSFLPAITVMSAHFAQIAPEGVPLFASTASASAARLLASLGFARARDHFPDADDDVLVVFRASAPSAQDAAEPPAARLAPHTITRVTRTIEDIMKVFTIRAATYMREQSCPFDEEFDGNDFCAAHILGEIDGEPAGCIRVRFFGDFVKIERLAVRHEFRASRLAFQLVRAALDYARAKGFRRAYGHSRHDLVRFWSRFGFRAIPGRPTFTFSDVDYVEMATELSPATHVVAIGRPPLELIRPEGQWDRPGPLDRSAARGAARAANEALRPAAA